MLFSQHVFVKDLTKLILIKYDLKI